MGEAIITRASNVKSAESAVIRVATFSGASVSCTDGKETQTGYSAGSIDFHVGYGKWSVSSTYGGNTRTSEIVVDTLKIYDLNLKGVTYGILIDMNNGDPTSAVSYIDDAQGMIPLSCNLGNGACDYGSWEAIISDWIGCKPCLYSNGQRVAYLNKNNYNQKVDGSAADISSGGSGDVMIEFASRWYKYSSPNSTTLKFEVCDYDRTADGFVKAAFLSENGSASMRDYFYYGVYNGYVESSKLRSLSGKTPTVNISYNDSLLRAAQNHSSCTIETLFKRMYILGLTMLVTRTRGIQSMVGHGVVTASAAISTGTMNHNGLFYGRSDGTSGVKCFGIENLWGNLRTWMAGLVTKDSSGTLGIKSCAPYSPDGSNYINVTTGTGTSGGYPTRCNQFGDGAIILPAAIQSDATKGWPDYFYVYSTASQVADVGGYWNGGLDYAGPFCAYVYNTPTDTYTNCGPRLVAS